MDAVHWTVQTQAPIVLFSFSPMTQANEPLIAKGAKCGFYFCAPLMCLVLNVQTINLNMVANCDSDGTNCKIHKESRVHV